MENTFSVLVVDDDHISRRLLAKALTTEGHRVVSVENGRKALDSYRNEFFPIVLTDWNMPEMDGLELCRAIRERHSSSYVFIILLTSRDSKQDIVSGLGAGADDYLTKPFDPPELIARLNTGIRILELERSLNKALEEIETLSVTDALTQVYNRRYLNENFADGHIESDGPISLSGQRGRKKPGYRGFDVIKPETLHCLRCSLNLDC